MKRLFSIFCLLCMMVVVHAEFRISIAGGEYISELKTINVSSELGSGTIKTYRSGSSYYVELNNVNITTRDNPASLLIEGTAKESVTIVLKGKNYIKNGHANALELNGFLSLYIQSGDGETGSLKLNAHQDGLTIGTPSFDTQTCVYIKNCYVVIEGRDYAITNRCGYYKLNIINSYVSCYSVYREVINFVSSFNLTNCSLVNPSGAAYDESRKSIRINGEECYDCIISNLDEYGIMIGGTHITKSNYADPLGDGKISFNPTTYTLTLNNAVVNADLERGIYTYKNNENNLTINLIGKNVISSQADKAMYLRMNTTITSSTNGELTVNAGDYDAIVHSKPLLIKDCTMEVNSNESGIVGGGRHGLNLENVNLSVNSQDYALKHYSLDLKGCYVSYPYGYEINSMIGKLICKVGEGYDLAFDNVTLDKAKANDVYGDGSVSYDDATKTLTLKDAYVPGLKTNMENINIYVKGECRIKTNGTTGINRGVESGNTTIYGDGYEKSSLEIELPWKSNNAICTCGDNLTIKNVYIKSPGKIFGQGSWYEYKNKFTIDNAAVELGGGIFGFGSMTSKGAKIQNPVNGYYNTETHSLCDADGESELNGVLIGPKLNFPLYYHGDRVTSDNADNIVGDGSVSYNHAKRTLTLSNASLGDTSLGNAFTLKDDMTVNLQGENTIRNWNISAENTNTTFTGNGKLTVSGPDAFNSTGNLSVTGGCSVSFEGAQSPGIKLQNGVINVEASTLMATGSKTRYKSFDSISGCCDLSLTNCSIISDHTFKDGVFYNPAGTKAYDQIIIGEFSIVNLAKLIDRIKNTSTSETLDDVEKMKKQILKKTY